MKNFQEIKESGDKVEISEFKNKLPDPPMVLVLKRKAIRIFPSGQRVALYHSDKLGIDITIPYSPSMNKNTEVAGVTTEETLVEAEHDDLFGNYTAALKKHFEVGSKHTDHPELLKMKMKTIAKYGKEAHSHLHAAAEHMLNGDLAKASRRYSKFERTINEGYEEVLDEAFLSEGAIHKLHHIVQTKTGGTVNFKNGSTARVEYPQAAHIMKLHSSVNPENKTKIENLVNASPAGLSKVADFAAENLK